MGVKERILKYLEYKDIKVTRAEQELGWSKSSLLKSNNVSGDKIGEFVLLYTDLSAEWLLTGEGSMLKSKDPAVIPLSHDKVSYKLLPMSEFNLYDIDVSAGLSRLFSEEGDRNKAFLCKISIPNMPKCDGAVKVIGDSMYPLLKSGDIIAYKEVHSIEAVQWGEIYILQLEYDSDISVVVKYVKKSERGDEYINLVSYNKEHDPKEVKKENITAMARVMVCIRQMSIM